LSLGIGGKVCGDLPGLGWGGVSFQSGSRRRADAMARQGGLPHSKALRAAEVVADFGGGWVITKKVFFIARKKMVFWRIWEGREKVWFGSMNTGVW